MNRMLKSGCLVFSLLITFSISISEAKEKFYFGGDVLRRLREVHGRIEISIDCPNKIDVEALGVSLYSVESGRDVYVSKDHKYFIFGGTAGQQGRKRFFLGDVKNCKIIRELTIDEEYEPFNLYAAFSPDTSKLYVTLDVMDESGKYLQISREYSGSGFNAERNLANIFIPKRADDGKRFDIEFYKFSQNGQFIIVVNNTNWEASIFRTATDEKIRSLKIENYFVEKKSYFGDCVPDIFNEYLLYSFDVFSGTEMDIFDYKSTTLKKKFIIPLKGTGMFSSTGTRIIFSAFPNTIAWTKDVIIYDTATGALIGTATLDEIDDVIDMTSDDKQLIYRRSGTQMRIDIRPTQTPVLK